MSNMVTLKTSKVNRFNKGIILAGIEVKFDMFGMTDVVERHVETLIEAGLEPVDKQDVEKYKSLKESVNLEVPEIDVIDENTKLKKQIEILTNENQDLKQKLFDLETEQNLNVKTPEADIEEAEKDGINIDAMKLTDLKEICKSIGLPKSEWNTLKIDELRAYVKEKLKE
jgi:hypothetical protein